MGIADELDKLSQLKASGALSDAEFQSAKARLLRPEGAAVAAAAPVPTTRLAMRPGGIALGLILTGAGVWMFATLALSPKGNLIALGFTVGGLIQIVTGSARRVKA